MVSQVTNVVFGNSENILVAARYPTKRLLTYSRTAETKLNQMDGGSTSGSERSGTTNIDSIRYDTAEGILPVMTGMEIVLKFMNMRQHPAKGYPDTYKGHKQLTLDLARSLQGRPLTFSGLLRIQEALLLLNPKDHLSRQFHIRNAIMNYISTAVLTPDELYKTGQIFSHPATADQKLINHVSNKTVDFMEDGLEDGTISSDEYHALIKVSEAVPALDDKMTQAYLGQKARKQREAAKATRVAELQVEHETHNHGFQASAKNTKQSKELSQLEELERATDGLGPLPRGLASKLMTGPVIFKGEIAKEV